MRVHLAGIVRRPRLAIEALVGTLTTIARYVNRHIKPIADEGGSCWVNILYIERAGGRLTCHHISSVSMLDLSCCSSSSRAFRRAVAVLCRSSL